MESKRQPLLSKLKTAGVAGLMILGLVNMILMFSGVSIEPGGVHHDGVWMPFQQTSVALDSTSGNDSIAGFRSAPETKDNPDSVGNKKSDPTTSAVEDTDEPGASPFPLTRYLEPLVNSVVIASTFLTSLH